MTKSPYRPHFNGTAIKKWVGSNDESAEDFYRKTSCVWIWKKYELFKSIYIFIRGQKELLETKYLQRGYKEI